MLWMPRMTSRLSRATDALDDLEADNDSDDDEEERGGNWSIEE